MDDLVIYKKFNNNEHILWINMTGEIYKVHVCLPELIIYSGYNIPNSHKIK